MRRVALTGGIATGKSVVRRALAARGVPTVDADGIVHELLGPGTTVSAAIAARFGAGALCADGSVNRRALGRIVFGDADARRALEDLVHPEVYARIGRWFDEAARRGDAWAVADIPLLFETGRQNDFDRVIVTACEVETQVARIVARDRLEEAEARDRLAAQWPIVQKVALADVVIRTDGTMEDTLAQVDRVVAWMVVDAETYPEGQTGSDPCPRRWGR